MAGQEFDRTEMVKAFEETKGGVKGLIDSGRLPELAKIFIRPSEEMGPDQLSSRLNIGEAVPVVDLGDVQTDPLRRKQIVEQVKAASESWGFFQVVNHGIPSDVIDGMIDGIQRFNDMDIEERKKYYSRDNTRSVRYNSSYDLFTSRTASWRDTLSIAFNSGTRSQDPLDLPPTCREYSVWIIIGSSGTENRAVKKHGMRSRPPPLLPLLSGMPSIGVTKHSDAGFLTILLQNQICNGLQVLYQGKWIDIHPIPGALVVNIGDLLQVVSNGRFKSSEHRAKVNEVGPRISVACFFSGPPNEAKTYAPIQEMISKENPPLYKEIILGQYRSKILTIGLEDYRALDYYKIVGN